MDLLFLLLVVEDEDVLFLEADDADERGGEVVLAGFFPVAEGVGDGL